jgi:hypothetical protein
MALSAIARAGSDPGGYPVKPAGFHYVFHNIPGYYRDIPLFNIGFDQSVMHAYATFDGKVFRSEDLAGRPELINQLPDIPVKYFIYSASSRRLLEIPRSEWERLNRLESQGGDPKAQN